MQFSNSAHLIEDHGWTGVLVDKSPVAVQELHDAMGGMADIRQECVGIDNVNLLVPDNTWLLSIDIDSDDWWIWANLLVRPAIVIIETNAVGGLYVCAYRSISKHDYGCSLRAAIILGTMKGYTYLGKRDVNAYFVRGDLTCEYRVPEIPCHRNIAVDSRERNVLCA